MGMADGMMRGKKGEGGGLVSVVNSSSSHNPHGSHGSRMGTCSNNLVRDEVMLEPIAQADEQSHPHSSAAVAHVGQDQAAVRKQPLDVDSCNCNTA